MTRLTNELRDHMFRKIMKDLPNRDFQTEIFNLVQQAVRDFMPKKLQAVFDDPKLRKLLTGQNVKISHGSRTNYLYGKTEAAYYRRAEIVGLENELTIRISDAENELLRVKEGTLYHHLLFKTPLVELYHGWVAQDELRGNVEKRLKANLAAATTIKKLYEVLEPELHGFIPRDEAREPLLPATVAPVVDDLKKLGFAAPVVPKAEATT